MEGHSSAKNDTRSMEYPHRSSPQDEPAPPSSLSLAVTGTTSCSAAWSIVGVSLCQNPDLLGRTDSFECILRP